MIEVEILPYTEVEKIAQIFHRDGFALVSDALTPDQLSYVQAGASRVMADQMQETPLEQANRGYARYSFGNCMIHPEWILLIDLPTILPILDGIFGGPDYICSSASGDYNGPGAEAQALHRDIQNNIHDPLNQIQLWDMPPPWVVVNYLMCDITDMNGPIRMIPHTHRIRFPVPSHAEEPNRMKCSTICAPAGTVLIRDVRTWHGGTDNKSDQIGVMRAMVDVGYFAPWYRIGWVGRSLPMSSYEKLSDRGKQICRYVVDWQETIDE